MKSRALRPPYLVPMFTLWAGARNQISAFTRLSTNLPKPASACLARAPSDACTEETRRLCDQLTFYSCMAMYYKFG